MIWNYYLLHCYLNIGNRYLVISGTITAGCPGDVFARVGVFPLANLNRCIAGQCILTETGTTSAYFITIGSTCGVNICKGSNSQSFPGGMQ